jgi:hypothetical protein
MGLIMSEPKRIYIAQGLDQQGRRATGVWSSDDIGRSAWRSPHRTGADFVDTYPTGPAPLEAAHAASELDEAPETVDAMKRRYVDLFVSVALVALCVVVVVLLASAP